MSEENLITEYSDDQLTKIIVSYKKMRAREKRKYIKRKEKDGFVEMNRARAKAHYDAHKEVKAQKYQDNQQLLKYKSLYNYYKLNDKINVFINKYPDRVDYLNQHGFKVVAQVQQVEE